MCPLYLGHLPLAPSKAAKLEGQVVRRALWGLGKGYYLTLTALLLGVTG